MALEDILRGATVRPVFVGFLDFASDPVRGWTGPGSFLPVGTGDADLDGFTFFHAGGAITLSPFHEDQGIGSAITITMAAGDMDDEEGFQQLVVDRRVYLGRKAKFWQFFLTADESAVLADYQVMFDGLMTAANLTASAKEPAIISITCDLDVQKAVGAPTRMVDHQALNPGDTFSAYMIQLMRGPLTLPASNQVSPGEAFIRNFRFG